MILLFLLLFAKCLACDFEVGEVSFDGRCMQLSEGFQWEMPFGKIQGKSALVYFELERNNDLPHEIVMQEGVDIALKEGGNILSPYARLDCRLWQGFFHGHEGKKIQYEKENLSLMSLKMELRFVPPTKERPIFLESIIAEGQVVMKRDPDLEMTAEKAIFDQFSPQGMFNRTFLFGDGKSLPCKMIQENGSEVLATEIELDLKENKVVLISPEGKLENKTSTPLHFKASKMIGLKNEERLELFPPLLMQGLGNIESDGILQIDLEGKQIKKAVFNGHTQLYWKNPKDTLEHRLVSYGIFSIDPILQEVVARSPAADLQIAFSDHYGEIFADDMTLAYGHENGKMVPVSIRMQGNVRLQNHSPGALQYALADEAVLQFGNKTMTLQAKTRPRVLFYDELNKVQASAPGLVISRDPASGQEILKGMGNVRFIFAEQELDELKKRFSFEPRK